MRLRHPGPPAHTRYLAQPVRVRDGRPAWIREVRPDDAGAVGRFVQGLSPSSRYFRFMMGMRELSEDALRHFTRPASGREGVLVATPGTSLARIVGIAQFVMDDDGENCEFALVVDDAWQRQGLGTRLLAELSGYAALHGVTRIHADVLADNHATRRFAEKSGFELHAHVAAPFVLRLSGRLDLTDGVSRKTSKPILTTEAQRKSGVKQDRRNPLQMAAMNPAS